ncbi:ATP-binding protein [Aureibacillus halotolerans]|uniref:Putative kinase n=1 Tax=Aureibacillus halotolerans TaxID=1508390 RepID=A0A4R6TVB5_9BACI|nr:ATP-binding protein [Aureibacillus halotolerans]TDQ36602.1 putative kinase [Aureibacillus halotolerans]
MDKRIVIMTVGKTHSGKTTFARALEKRLTNVTVIDQDVHAAFLLENYASMLPKRGPNRLKYALTQTIVDYAIKETDHHLILCNANLRRQARSELLERFHKNGFVRVLVHFDWPDDVLKQRITNSHRRKDILRTASSFKEVLQFQDGTVELPHTKEADVLFTIKEHEDMNEMLLRICQLAQEGS